MCSTDIQKLICNSSTLTDTDILLIDLKKKQSDKINKA